MLHSIVSLGFFLFILHKCETHTISSSNINCNFDIYENGCVDTEGSECNTVTNKCVCKNGFTIQLSDFCLQRKFIGDKCFASAQCNHIPNAGCFSFREEFDYNPSAFLGPFKKKWTQGKCRCKIGHRFEKDTNSCAKKTIGSWCSNVWDCRHDQLFSTNTICEENVCKCSAHYLYNKTTQKCDYQETYGRVCQSQQDCFQPNVCLNGTCVCDEFYHYDQTKSPHCQPNNDVKEQKSEGTFGRSDKEKGDRSFEIFIITVIPLIILFLTIKPCWNRVVRCKTPPEQIICGSKEIKIKNNCSLNAEGLESHYFTDNNRLQTIEEINEEGTRDNKEEIVISFNASQTDEKSIEENQLSEKEKLEMNQSQHSINEEVDSCASSSNDTLEPPNHCND